MPTKFESTYERSLAIPNLAVEKYREATGSKHIADDDDFLRNLIDTAVNKVLKDPTREPNKVCHRSRQDDNGATTVQAEVDISTPDHPLYAIVDKNRYAERDGFSRAVVTIHPQRFNAPSPFKLPPTVTIGDTLRPAIPLRTTEKETILLSWLTEAGAAQYAEILRDDLSSQVAKLGSVAGLKVWKPTKFKTRQVVELVE